MRGDNHELVLTTAIDDITGEVKPLFGFPIQVCKATESKDVKFDNACPSGAPTEGLLRLDPATGEAFATDATRKGIRSGEAFHEISATDLKAIDDSTKRKQMIALGKVPFTEALAKYGDRATGTYFLQSPPKGGAHKAYRLTYEALREVPKKGKTPARPAQAIVTKRTARTRQKLCLIYADEAAGCLKMIELAFAEDIREPDSAILAPQETEVNEKQLGMARQIIDEKIGDGFAVLETEIDEARPLRRQLVEDALAGKTIATPKPEVEVVQTDNLEALLEASVKQAVAA